MSYKSLVENFIDVHLENIIDKVYKDGKNIELLEIKAFNEKAQFTNGKVVNAVTYLLEKKYPSEKGQKVLKEMLNYTFETWGILNSLLGFLRLHKKGILNSTIDPKILEEYRKVLVTESFLNSETLELIDKPTNYYGVAFGIAAIREILGWENSVSSRLIFEKLTEHIIKYSGEHEFMDETSGEGRFDRYSFLIPAEICHLLEITEQKIPDLYKRMLKKSAKLFLSLANEEGTGFSYGRSIGAYGDTAGIEVLSLAAKVGVLNPDEEKLAYLYNLKTAYRVREFWYDKELKSLNFWLKGRKTDSYRNINRVLGENISIPMQVLTGYHHYEEMGIAQKEFSLEEFKALVEKEIKENSLEEISLMEGEYPRKLFTYKIEKNTFLLPFINGSKKYYKSSPYYPIPQCVGVVDSPVDESYPQLMPEILLKTGEKLLITPYLKAKKINSKEIVAKFQEVTKTERETSEKLESYYGEIKYIFNKNEIKVEFEILGELKNIEEIKIGYLSFENSPKVEFQGFDSEESLKNRKEHSSNIGFFQNETVCRKKIFCSKEKEIRFSYKIRGGK